MNTRTIVATAAAAAALLLTACTAPADSKPAAPVVTETVTSLPAPPAAETPEVDPPASTPAEAEAETAELPDLVGEILQTAQDESQAAGFYGLTSSDASGQARFQVLDRNWKVCTQTPAAGTHPTDTIVDFGTVKIEEDCP